MKINFFLPNMYNFLSPFSCLSALTCYSTTMLKGSDGRGLGFPSVSYGKELVCNAENPGSIPWWEDPLENVMVTHSKILAWRIPLTEGPGRLQSMRLQRVGHD